MAQLAELTVQPFPPAEMIDGAVLCGGHQPRAWVARHTSAGPLLQRGDQRILRKFLGKTDVADDPGETADNLCGLDPPDRINRRVRVGSRRDDELERLALQLVTQRLLA